jgi:4-hydroxy-tetrahydrodipicolinate synthase
LNSTRALIERLRAVFVTTVTPFDAGGAVDYGRLRACAEYLVDAGVGVLVPCGNTGEFSSLSLDEAARVTEVTVETVSGRAVVIAGVGWSMPMALELSRRAAASGADGVMAHHPVHTYIDREGLRRYYEGLIEELEIGLVLYKRGPELTDELIAELVQRDEVVGVKYAVNDLNAFANLVAGSSAEVAWLCGTAERWAPFFYLAGAVGFSSGLANFAPRESLSLLEALQAGDWSRAMEIRAKLTPFEEIRQGRFNGNNVPAVKEAMRIAGLCEATVREPLLELDPATARRVGDMVAAWDLELSAVEP